MPNKKNNHKLILSLLIAQFVWCGLSLASQKSVDEKTKLPANTITKTADTIVSAADDQPLQEVIKIADIGAPGLALRMMDHAQKGIRSEISRWMIWEQQRLRIYESNQNWDRIISRVEHLPDTVSIEFSRWALTQKAQAYLQLQKGKLARQQLRPLALSASGEESQSSLDWLQQWRRMIIHSYIAEGLDGDALISILRFQQDYSTDKKEILFLRARVLLMTHRASEATELLTDHTKDPEAGMLFLLAQLRSEARSPVKVVQAGLRHLRGKRGDHSLRTSLWAVVAEAAQRAGDRGSAVNALEHYMANTKQPLMNKLFAFDVDSLWNAYLDYALHAGNEAQLLVGQDEAWFKYALDSGKKFPVRKRAIYALLMHRGSHADHRLKAAKLFLKSIQARRNNRHLTQQLFTQSKFYPSVTDIPEPVRRALVDIALARQDIPFASKIMASLDEPPKGKASYMWHLRRARILILGGQASEGVLALTRFIQTYPEASRKQIDRFLQVVFDLQTVGEHDSAYQLFDYVINLSKDKKLQRELYYWMADSRHAQSRYADAAELYLKSAMLLDGKGWDPWGQTARYQAAKSLGKAGLIEDAYFMYQRLLKVTKEDDRQAVLRYEVQKLKLAKSEEQESIDNTNAEMDQIPE